MNNSNASNLSTNKMVKFFCHKCEKQQEAEEDSEVMCPVCKLDFVEIIDSENQESVPRPTPVNERSANSGFRPFRRNMQEFGERLERMYFDNSEDSDDMAFARGMHHLTFQDMLSINHQMAAMMDQIEGIPPSSDAQIKEMPIITIEAEHLVANPECSICFDNFTIGENVKKLFCNHIFHVPCIVPWLKLHGSCPVCRKQFSTRIFNPGNPFTNDPGFFGPVGFPNSVQDLDQQVRRLIAERQQMTMSNPIAGRLPDVSVQFFLPPNDFQNERGEYLFPARPMFMHPTRPTSENRQVATENRQVATENRQVATENRQVATENRQVATENRQVATGNRQVATENATECPEEPEEPEEPTIDSANPDAISKSDDKKPPTNE